MRSAVTCILLFAIMHHLHAQSGNIILHGTPGSDSARKALSLYDTVFIYAAHPLPDSIVPCNAVTKQMYPAEQRDDYLHEERFDSLYHVVIFDHIVTRKFLNILLPGLQNSKAELCNVTLTLQHPATKQVVVFYDIFNWMNNEGEQIFNTNREVHNLWGISGAVVVFPVKLYHSPSGSDYTFGHTELKLRMNGFE